MLGELVPSRVGRGVSAGDPFSSLRRDIDRFFDDFWRDFGTGRVNGGTQLRSLLAPRIDISDTGEAIQVTAELPGLEEKDIEVVYQDGVLLISGEKTSESSQDGTTWYLRERSYGHFHREIPLNVEIDSDKIEAAFRNGVLTVTLPKTPEAQKTVKRIPVKA